MHCPLPSLESPWLGVNIGKQGGSVEQEEPHVSPDLNVSRLTCIIFKGRYIPSKLFNVWEIGSLLQDYLQIIFRVKISLEEHPSMGEYLP